MSRWSTTDQGTDQVDVFVQDPLLGRCHVGTLYLNRRDAAELAELLARGDDE